MKRIKLTRVMRHTVHVSLDDEIIGSVNEVRRKKWDGSVYIAMVGCIESRLDLIHAHSVLSGARFVLRRHKERIRVV